MTQTMTRPPKPRRRPGYLTFEAFLAMDEPERAEWVDGRLVEMPGITSLNDEVTTYVSYLMMDSVLRDGSGRISHDPFLMRLLPDGPARAPDILFVRTEHLNRYAAKCLEGPADVAVEVISPGSRTIDRGEKYYEYEAGGVPEYWLIDPERLVAEFYRLDTNVRYQPIATPDGIFRSEAFPGFWLRVEWLWSRPPLREVEAELAAGPGEATKR